MHLQLNAASAARLSSALSMEESPVVARKRQRISAFSDDDGDDSLDIPLDKRPAARAVRNVHGLEEGEEEEAEYHVPIREPSMRRRIEKHQTCEYFFPPNMACSYTS